MGSFGLLAIVDVEHVDGGLLCSADRQLVRELPCLSGCHASNVVRPAGSICAGSMSTCSTPSGSANKRTECSCPGRRRMKNWRLPRHTGGLIVPDRAELRADRASSRWCPIELSLRREYLRLRLDPVSRCRVIAIFQPAVGVVDVMSVQRLHDVSAKGRWIRRSDGTSDIATGRCAARRVTGHVRSL